jgi:hypothetical protein
MRGEVDVLGVYIPTLIVLMLFSYCINRLICICLARLGAYRFVWHRSIFDLALYVLVLVVIVDFSHR